MYRFFEDVMCFLRQTTNILPLAVDDNIVQVSCHFDISQFDKNLLNRLPEPIRRPINQAVIKRQAEFIAGRYCVARALYKLTHSEDVWVTNHPDRSPAWPAGIVGSISHSHTSATAIVARQKCVQSVGVDIETLISAQQAQQIAPVILAEQPPLTEHCSLSEFVILVFSAKETLFKTLYPLSGKMMNFNDADCIALDTQQGICRLRLRHHEHIQVTKQAEFDIAYAMNQQSVMTRLLLTNS